MLDMAAPMIDAIKRRCASAELRAMRSERARLEGEGRWTAHHQTHYERRLFDLVAVLLAPPIAI